MDHTCIFLGTLFTIAGCLFACGKGHIHFAAWKTMPREEKEKIDIVPLCRNIGNIIVLNGLLFLLKGVWSGFTDFWFTAAMLVWLMIAGCDIWYIEKSNRYRKK